MKKTRFALATLLALTALVAAAKKPLFDYRVITLDNGLEVITLEDFSCPIVSVQVWYHVGSKDEQPDRQGFAHMFEHMMFFGTDRVGPTDHNDLIHRVGGSSNAYTNFDQTVYHQKVPADQWEMVLWLEAERMAFLNINQESFDTERKVVEEERRLGLNQPYGDAWEKLMAEIFRVHPYRWTPIGQIPHLRAATVGELREFWKRYYVPNNATLVILGAVKHRDAQRLAKKYFGWIPRCPDPPRVTVKEPPTQERKVTLKIENAPAPLVGRGFRTVPLRHDDVIPLDLLATILGGGESSRLHRQLVAEQRLAVGAQAMSWNLEQDGLWGAGAILTPFGGDADQVSQIIERHITRVRDELVSERELTKARNQMLKSFVLQNLTVDSKAAALGEAAVLEGDVSRVNERLDRVRRVTAADLQRVARTYFLPERQIELRVERNLTGAVGNLIGSKEDASPITAPPETSAPPPGREGVRRPAHFPARAPAPRSRRFPITPQFTEDQLANGLKVLVVPNHEVPLVSITLLLRDGAVSETKVGAASMAFDLLTKGTAGRSEAELAEELETYAISLSGIAGMDTSRVFADCLPEQLPRAMSLLAEVILTPTFPAEEFDKLRAQTRTALEVQTAEPSYLADREFRRRLYGAHPYSRTTTGELEDLEQLTVADARAWWEEHFRLDDAILIFAGDITRAPALQLAQNAFGGWKPTRPHLPHSFSAPPAAAPTRIYLVDRPTIQSEIRVGQLGITRKHPDYFVSRVVTNYFGDAFNSRLNDALRVKRGLTYGAGGGYSADPQYGRFWASTFTKTESTAETVRAIFEECERLRREPPKPQELDDQKRYLLGSFPAGRETPQQVAGDLALIEAEGLPRDYFTRLLAGVARTRAEDCARLVRSTVDPSRMIAVVVGPADQIRADLGKIAPVTVVK